MKETLFSKTKVHELKYDFLLKLQKQMVYN